MRPAQDVGLAARKGQKSIMHPVPQEDDYGCGCACIASIVGLTYAAVRKKLKWSHLRTGGLIAGQLSAGLKAFGRRYHVHFTKSRDVTTGDIPIGAIVKVRGKKYGTAGHYLVRTPDGWMDPWFNCPAGAGDTGPGRRNAKLRTRRPATITSVLLPR